MSTRIPSWFRELDDSDECELTAMTASSETWTNGPRLSSIDFRFVIDNPEHRVELTVMEATPEHRLELTPKQKRHNEVVDALQTAWLFPERAQRAIIPECTVVEYEAAYSTLEDRINSPAYNLSLLRHMAGS